MEIKVFFSILLLIIVQSCGQENHVRTYRLPKPEKSSQKQKVETPTSGFSWEKPENWIPSAGSNMRLASFDVPFSDAKGDLSLIKLSGTGGDLESNINRWRGQLGLASQSLSEMKKNITTKEGKLGKYQLIKLFNNQSNSAFLCAIMPVGSQTLFVKLSGGLTGIQESETDFISFCSSIDFLE